MQRIGLSNDNRLRPVTLSNEGKFLSVDELEKGEPFRGPAGLSQEEKLKLVLRNIEMAPDFAVGDPGGNTVTRDQLMDDVKSGTEFGADYMNAVMTCLSEIVDDMTGRSKRQNINDLLSKVGMPDGNDLSLEHDPFLFASADFGCEFLEKVYQFRSETIFPIFRELSNIENLYLKDDVRANFRNAVLKPETIYVSVSGHGEKDLAHDYSAAGFLWKVNNYDRDEVLNKIVHLFCCWTADTLGPDLVSKGALGYFGYIKPFVYFTEPGPHYVQILKYGDPFWISASSVDVFLYMGYNCGQTGELTKGVYNWWIDYARSEYPLEVAQMLTLDRDNFRSPLDNEIYGNKNAKLKVPGMPEERIKETISFLSATVQ